MYHIYINFILEPFVKFWIIIKKNFVLKEDSNLSHGLNKKNLVYI